VLVSAAQEWCQRMQVPAEHMERPTVPLMTRYWMNMWEEVRYNYDQEGRRLMVSCLLAT
jgi:hypothetical protein